MSSQRPRSSCLNCPTPSRGSHVAALLAACLGAACGQDEEAPKQASPMTCGAAQNQMSGGTSVVNDSCALDREVMRSRQDVPIEPAAADPTQVPTVLPATVPVATLTLLATVKPPVVRGAPLQAVGITLKGSYAIVSYMLAGEPRAGAIDVLRLADPERPELASRATFDDADVLGADFDEGHVWYVGGVADPKAPSSAFLRAMRLRGWRLDLAEVGSAVLPSYAGTGISVSSKKRIHVTSGNAGVFATFTYAKGAFAKQVEFPVHDGRGVALEGDRIAVVGGTPGTLLSFTDGAAMPSGRYAFPGADVPEARSGIEVVGGKAFVAAGTGGLQILSLATGQRLGGLAAPEAGALGSEPGSATTNGVAVDRDLVFLCNGGAGIWVAQAASDLARSGSEEPQRLTLLGHLGLGRSANHVAFKGKYLMVAAGSGGVQVVRVDRE